MQSDDALDAQIEIYDTAFCSFGESSKKIQQDFIKHYDDIVETCNKYHLLDSSISAVYWQVFAVESMRHGINLNEAQQKQIIEGITSCEEYKKCKYYPNMEDLHEELKKDYIQNFDEEDWNAREKLWGKNSYTQRVIERTYFISQLLDDFNEFSKNGFIPFERKEDNLFETIGKKMKLS